MPQRSSSPVTRLLVIGACAGALVLGVVLAVRARSAEPAPSASASADADTSLQALLSASPEPSAGVPADPAGPRARILGQQNLEDAIAIARPLMTNTSGKLDSGAGLLAVWAAEHLTWDGLQAVAQTSPALFRKDPDAERGKRFCMTGTILQIRAEKGLDQRALEDRAMPLIERPGSTYASAPLPLAAPSESAEVPPPLAPAEAPAGVDLSMPKNTKVYVAVLREKTDPTESNQTRETSHRSLPKDPLVVELIAVKSSGSLVDGDDARACGVLTGVTLPASGNVTTFGDVLEHRLVGMFDLPENH